jgi:antitoxin component of RelBE/YafQ-DinJ toxin-antitoxin module
MPRRSSALPALPMSPTSLIGALPQAVLARTGVSISAIVDKIFAYIAEKGVLPSELFEPNVETIAAMEAADRGEVETVRTIEEMHTSMIEGALRAFATSTGRRVSTVQKSNYS